MSMFDDIALVRSEFDDSWLIESLEASGLPIYWQQLPELPDGL